VGGLLFRAGDLCLLGGERAGARLAGDLRGDLPRGRAGDLRSVLVTDLRGGDGERFLGDCFRGDLERLRLGVGEGER